MKATLRRIHRYISLTLASVWLVQALTGAIMVFHWEWDDALVPGMHRPIDLLAIGDVVERVQRERSGATVKAFYATAGAPDRFDIHVQNAAGGTDIVRIDGAGQTLVARPLDYDYRKAGFIQAAIVLHQTLFAGDRGKLFLGVSALILLTNVVFGLKLAWPRRGEWGRALKPGAAGARVANLFAWHRACGLWLAWPAFILVTAGMLLAFEDPLEDWLGTGRDPPVLDKEASTRANSLATAIIGPGAALQAGLAKFPSASLSSLRMPAEGAPWYRVRVLQPGEPPRVYGNTAVYVSAEDGRILAIDDALQGSAKQRLLTPSGEHRRSVGYQRVRGHCGPALLSIAQVERASSL